jgi:hypothetical protein
MYSAYYQLAYLQPSNLREFLRLQTGTLCKRFCLYCPILCLRASKHLCYQKIAKPTGSNEPAFKRRKINHTAEKPGFLGEEKSSIPIAGPSKVHSRQHISEDPKNGESLSALRRMVLAEMDYVESFQEDNVKQ